MTIQERKECAIPLTLEDAMHGLRNQLSAIRSGCVLVDDALARGQGQEASLIVAEMREALGKACGLTRVIPVFVTAAQGC